MFNNYEIVEYIHSLPLQIQSFTGRTIQDDRGDIKDVLEHWHQEIENAACRRLRPGRVIRMDR